jgi:hypothetical protein
VESELILKDMKKIHLKHRNDLILVGLFVLLLILVSYFLLGPG